MNKIDLMMRIKIAILYILTGFACFFIYWKSLSGLDKEAFGIAMEFYGDRIGKLQNKEYITIIDYTRPSFAERLHICNMSNGKVESYLVSHGHGGNKGNVYIPAVSNEPGSKLSSSGFCLTGERYAGKHGLSLRLHGLEEGINDNMYNRGIIMHSAPYVSYKAMFANLMRRHKPMVGESEGCLVVRTGLINNITEMIRGGSLVYIHTER
jgi:hypothetical protein